MRVPRMPALLIGSLTIACILCGCEGVSRKHDLASVNVQPPPEDYSIERKPASEKFSIPDLVEHMFATRNTHIAALEEMERAYLTMGDAVRANWARRQRQLIAGVDVFPYLTDVPEEHRIDAAPEQSIAEADALFEEAHGILSSFRGVPLVGLTRENKQKARDALKLFKRVLSEHPKSDKVDDAAFYCGEIYKEYLREDDPNDELSVRYYKWAFGLDSKTPHAARFQCAVVYDFRRHDRARALELYHKVIELEEDGNMSNQRFAASRIEQLTDEEYSHIRPDRGGPPTEPGPAAEPAPEPRPDSPNRDNRVSGTIAPDDEPEHPLEPAAEP